jgi:hypothetical protein
MASNIDKIKKALERAWKIQETRQKTTGKKTTRKI